MILLIIQTADTKNMHLLKVRLDSFNCDIFKVIILTLTTFHPPNVHLY